MLCEIRAKFSLFGRNNGIGGQRFGFVSGRVSASVAPPSIPRLAKQSAGHFVEFARFADALAVRWYFIGGWHQSSSSGVLSGGLWREVHWMRNDFPFPFARLKFVRQTAQVAFDGKFVTFIFGPGGRLRMQNVRNSFGANR